MSVSRGLYVCSGLILASIAGCSAASAAPEEELVAVSGVVTMDGKPLEGALVSFVPTGTNGSARRGSGITDSDGQFQMLNYLNQEGLPVGAYVVVVSQWVMPDGSVPPADVPPATSGAVQAIPPLWRDMARAGSHNKVTVPEDGRTDFEFKIPKKN